MSFDYLSAFVVGLLGAGHCLGMCGGITGMLTNAIGPDASHQKLKLVVGYHLGRLSSYGLIGAIVGFSSSLAVKSGGINANFLHILSAIFLILLGFYIAQWWQVVGKIELIGKKLWQYIAPLAKHFLPVRTPLQALGLGALWGWLPCGLVYSMLTWALASGSAMNGGLILICFGLGTLPALISMSYGIDYVQSLMRNSLLRKCTGLAMIAYGGYTLLIASTQLIN
ncbi:sulfite exporter TauE/SafE family protein [Thalassotalea sp. LPB0316]|uniref:sulfite exporter TauE/SafE family protein n=1 Tax=Thalassotalea sp. LPB0316 TaxID=2769490 RepID=UPI0018675458|nr:sulfite exporter TauE/SafE family protein [Thalassotalea sp. LPB0316]QOL25048.1 sulfite exporter TauE/SafE family protein [Thalassotalea sp. LPB0316]